MVYKVEGYVTRGSYVYKDAWAGFLMIRFLAWTKLAQFKLQLSQFIINSAIQLCLTTCNTFIFCSHQFRYYQQQLTISAHYTLRHCGPSPTMAPGHKASSCAVWCAIGPYQKHCAWVSYIGEMLRLECHRDVHNYHDPFAFWVRQQSRNIHSFEVFEQRHRINKSQT